MFAEGLKSNECVKILMICLKNLEKEEKELKDLASSSNANQLKAAGPERCNGFYF